LSITVALRQLIGPLGNAEAPGGVIFCVTDATDVEVQPLGPVTVNVELPAVLTGGFCCVDVKPFGPLQAKVEFWVVVLPVSWTEDVEQVIGPLAVAVAPGGTMFCVTTTASLVEQPFTGLMDTVPV